jgi:CHAT domain-containing protein
MERFYQNLLGKREGLTAALPRAEALEESKRWLQALPREDALKHTAAVYAGLDRGPRKKRPIAPALLERTGEGKEDFPYAHPYYWASFILIGDPD